LLLVALLTVGAFGFYTAWQDARRFRVKVLTATIIIGVILSMGDQGPLGGVYRWLFLHLPLFAIMREPQKFIALVALGYAILVGWGVEALIELTRGQAAKTLASIMLAAIPIAYTPTLFFGMAGQLRTAQYPRSWTGADSTMGAGVGKVLFLPWHQYMSFPFTGRVIGNPANAVFRRDVIAGDNVELAAVHSVSRSQQSRYLEYLFANGTSVCSFGHLVAPLGVQYVFVAKTLDYARYSWLDQQADLVIAIDNADLRLYVNKAWASGAMFAERLTTVRDWSEVLTRANQGIPPGATIAKHNKLGSSPETACSDKGSSLKRTALVHPSPVRYDIGRSEPGFVAIPEQFDPTWRLSGSQPVELVGGTMGFQTSGNPTAVRYRHWDVVKVGYGISLLAIVLVSRKAMKARHRAPSDPTEEMTSTDEQFAV
jgi:hypothetical protein